MIWLICDSLPFYAHVDTLYFSQKSQKSLLLMLFHNEVKTVRNSLKVLSFCVVIMRFLIDVI